MKKFLNILILFIVFLNIAIFPTSVSASDNEYKHFLQGDSRWGSYVYGGNETIGGAGCAITSYTILAAYADPKLRDVKKFNPKIAAQDYLNFSGGDIYWNPKKGPLKYLGTSVTSKDAVKKALNKGYYIIAWSSFVYPSGTHFSPIVGWDSKKDKPIVWDVAGGGKTWDDFTAKSTIITGFQVYKSTKLNSKDAFAGAGDDSESSSKDSKLVKKQKEAYDNVLNEWKLHGMPKHSDIVAKVQDVKLADSNKLTLAEKKSKTFIQDSMDAQNKTAYQILNICCVVLGLLMIVYSLLLYLGFFVDRSNYFIDLSFVSLLTVGKVKLVDTKENLTDDQKEDGYVTSKTFFARCFIISLIGGLLVSSLVPKIVAMVIFALVL